MESSERAGDGVGLREWRKSGTHRESRGRIFFGTGSYILRYVGIRAGAVARSFKAAA